MITVKLINFSFENGISKDFFSLICSGHSGLAGKGNDIICAASSVLLETFVLSVSRVLGIKQKISQRDGFLSTEIDLSNLADTEINKLEILIKSFLLGILEIINQYPERIEIEFETD